MLDDFFTRAVIGGIGVALVAGPLGCFIIWRRLAYFGDTLSHSALLGVALALLFELNVTFAVFAISLVVSMLLMLLFYGGNVKLPFKLPGGVLAVATGWLIAVISTKVGYTWWVSIDSDALHSLPSTHFTFDAPKLHLGFLSMYLDREYWRYISVVIPMWLVQLVNNLANI